MPSEYQLFIDKESYFTTLHLIKYSKLFFFFLIIYSYQATGAERRKIIRCLVLESSSFSRVIVRQKEKKKPMYTLPSAFDFISQILWRNLCSYPKFIC